MRSLGIRCSGSILAYVVLEQGGDDIPSVLDQAQLPIPTDLSEDDALVWVRREVTSLTGRFQVSGVSIKVTEPTGRSGGTSYSDRVAVEAVVREGARAAGATVSRFIWSQIAAKIGKNGKEGKAVARRGEDLKLNSKKVELVEAALAGWAGMVGKS